MVRTAIIGGLLVALPVWSSGCASNPAPRPLPQPRGFEQAREQDQTQRPPAEAAARGETPPPEPAAPTNPAANPTANPTASAAAPDWYRPGAFELEGHEHRAFAVTAGDVRDARAGAMALAYERYPHGHVAAHEAVRQADGSWRFYVLMAAGG